MRGIQICTLSSGAVAGWIAAVSAEVLFLIFGILAIVPAGPFRHREIPVGVVLVVLALTQLAAIIAFLVFFGLTNLIGLPVGYAFRKAGVQSCCNCCDV